ncbi:hypothetical protein D3C87_395400 [compost metagenome]
MEKKLFYTAYALIVFMVLASCENKSNISQAIYFVENIQPIKDSVSKSGTYDIKLIVCSLKKADQHNLVILSIPDTPYLVKNKCQYKKIDGTDILFIDYDEEIVPADIPKDLLEKNLIRLDGKSKNTDPPFLKFVFCKNDFSSVRCFDNMMQDSLSYKLMKEKKTYSDKLFFPKCQ